MFEEYDYVHKQFITNKKADIFLSKQYYKILHLLTCEIIHKDLLSNNKFNLDVIESFRSRILGKPAGWWYSWRIYSCPLVLPLNCCKGFIHTNLENGLLAKRYPDCTFNEFDYIPVSIEEAIAAYGLNIPASYYTQKEDK